MAMRWAESWGSNANKYPSSEGSTIQGGGNSGGRFDSSAHSIGGGLNGVRKVFATGHARWAQGIAVNGQSAGSFRGTTEGTVMQLLDGGNAAANVQVEVTFMPDGSVKFYRGNRTVLVAQSAAGVIPNDNGVYHHLGFDITVGGAGSVALYVDGALAYSLSGINTQNTANASADRIAWGISVINGVATNSYNWNTDDWYVFDGSGTENNSFGGDLAIKVLNPSAVGTYSEWTRTGGSVAGNYTAVTNDDSDSSYVAAASAGLRDSYNYDDMPATTAAIKGVQVNMTARKDDAGSDSIARFCRSGGSDFVGSDIGLTSSYLYYYEVMEHDPATSADWTRTGLNAAEFGVKRTV